MSDEMSLLIEAFAAEAGDQIAQAAQDLKRLEETPTNVARWRAVAASLHLIASSATMIDLPSVEQLARLGHGACVAMAEHPDWQQVRAATAVGQVVAALDHLLANLPTSGSDGAEIVAEGLAAHEAWEQATRGVTGPAATPDESAATATVPHESAPTVTAPAADADEDEMPSWVAAGLPLEPEAPEIAAWQEAGQPTDTDEVVAVVPVAEPIPAPALEVVPPPSTSGFIGLTERLARWRRALQRGGASPAPAAPLGLTLEVDQTDLASPPSTNDAVVADAPLAVVADGHDPAVLVTEPVVASLEEARLPDTDGAATVTEPAVVEPVAAVSAATAPMIDAELLEVFGEEVGEHLAALDAHLAILRDQPDNMVAVAEVRRSLHTLKGAAGMVGLMPVHLLGRVAENTVESYLETETPAPEDLRLLIEATVDTLRAAAAVGFAATSLEAVVALTACWEALPEAAAATDARYAEAAVEAAVEQATPVDESAPMVATDVLLAEATLVEAAEPETPAEATSAVDPPRFEADDVLVAEMVAPANTAGVEDELIVETVETVETNASVTAPVLAEPVDAEEGAAWRLARAELAAVQSVGGEQRRSGSGTGDEDDRQLAELFADEVAEGLLVLHAMVAQLTEPEGAHGETVLALQRQVHTLKGAAAMMGRQSFATLTHRMEDVLERLAATTMPLTPAVVGLLFDTVDVLGVMARPDGEAAQQSTHALAIRYTAALGAVDAYRQVVSLPAATPTVPVPGAPSVRIDLDQLNGLMGMTEELVTHRAAFEERLGGLGGLLRDFDRSIERLGRVSRALEADYEAWGVAGEQRVVADLDDFDALELDRYTEFRRLTIELLEAVADARTVNRDVTSALTSMNTLVGRQGRVASAIRKGLETASLVALTGLAPMARRVASQAALTEGKRVAVEQLGLELLVDRTIYDVATTALGHLLRNAIVHGIETPEARRAAGKDEVGRLVIEARQESYETVLTVRDDGGGIDHDRVRRKAEALGWVTSDVPLTEADVFGFIFRPGFSTAEELDETAGRGVGLDAVWSAVVAVRGRVTVESTSGVGTCFTLRLPLAMTVAEVLLVDSGGQRLALPMQWLQGTQRVRTDELRPGPSGPETLVGDEWRPVLSLEELLGRPGDLAHRPAWPSVVVEAGESRAVVVVDRLVQRQELAIASLGPSFSWLRSMIGATLLGDGRVAPVLDLPALLAQGRVVATVETTAAVAHRPRIMVVDDSLSVRRVVTTALERQGWEAIQARNGQEALTLLTTTPIDAMLLDIEMPQMDGYSLLERLRSGGEYHHLPVAMLTSRSADKHRQRAFELGADAYLIKPYEEGQLIATLNELLVGAAVTR